MLTFTPTQSVESFIRSVPLLNNPDAALTHVAEAMGKVAVRLAKADHDVGNDPYGLPWNAPHNLKITGGISSYKVDVAGPDGFRVATWDMKASWHHEGSGHLPVRLILPTVAQGVPAGWVHGMNAAAERALAAESGTGFSSGFPLAAE